MTLLAQPQTLPAARPRLASFDRARGLAIALMVGDHVSLLLGFDLYRVTLGRAAMPLFFVLGGFLVSRIRLRHLDIALVGLLLPLVVPWIDRPNVLLWYALGAVAVWACRDRSGVLALFAVVALTLGANGWAVQVGSGYNPACLLGLMAVGRLLAIWCGPSAFGWAMRLPRPLGLLGRYPLSVYVGHLLVLQVFWWLGYWRV